MTARKTDEELLEGRHVRRMKQEDRFLDRLEKLEVAAEPLIGELCREGRTVYYVNLRTRNGTLTGKIKEFTFRFAASDYLIRNHYV